MSFPDMKDVQQEGCNRAVATAEGMGFPLDFTAESVQTLDRILGALHDAYIRTKNDEGYRGLSVMFAAYLVEVIERNFGRGRWERSHPALGQGSFPFYWNGAMLLPVEWCQKRIYEGPEEDVWSKFRLHVGDLPNASGRRRGRS